MIDITLITGRPAPGFIWHGNDGDYHPDSMSSRHLFNSLRLVWNNSVPDAMRVGRYVKRELNHSVFTKKYIVAAINSLIHEATLRPGKADGVDNPVEAMLDKLSTLGIVPDKEDVI